MDKEQTLAILLEQILSFNKERDWEKFHSPKNLIMDLATEIGELVEPFRWLTEKQSEALDEKAHRQVKEEIGDVFRILVYLSHKLGIDPVEAALEKLEKMKEKYPAERCYGLAHKYTAYENT